MGFNALVRQLCDLKIGLAFTYFFTYNVIYRMNLLKNLILNFGPY